MNSWSEQSPSPQISGQLGVYAVFCWPFFPMRDLWMWGMTPDRNTPHFSQTETTRHDCRHKPTVTRHEENKSSSPPPAIVALMRESNSSSPRIASCKWRGVIRFTFKSLEAFPANSSTWSDNTHLSKHSDTAEQQAQPGQEDVLQRWGTPGWRRCRRPLWLRRGRGWLCESSSVCGYDPLGTGRKQWKKKNKVTKCFSSN